MKCKEICVRKGRRQKVDFHREALRRNASQEKGAAAAPIVEALPSILRQCCIYVALQHFN